MVKYNLVKGCAVVGTVDITGLGFLIQSAEVEAMLREREEIGGHAVRMEKEGDLLQVDLVPPVPRTADAEELLRTTLDGLGVDLEVTPAICAYRPH